MYLYMHVVMYYNIHDYDYDCITYEWVTPYQRPHLSIYGFAKRPLEFIARNNLTQDAS